MQMNLEGLGDFDFGSMFSNIGQQITQAAPVLVKAAIDKKIAKATAPNVTAPMAAPAPQMTYMVAPSQKKGIDPKLLLGGGVIAAIALALLLRK